MLNLLLALPLWWGFIACQQDEHYGSSKSAVPVECDVHNIELWRCPEGIVPAELDKQDLRMVCSCSSDDGSGVSPDITPLPRPEPTHRAKITLAATPRTLPELSTSTELYLLCPDFPSSYAAASQPVDKLAPIPSPVKPLAPPNHYDPAYDDLYNLYLGNFDKYEADLKGWQQREQQRAATAITIDTTTADQQLSEPVAGQPLSQPRQPPRGDHGPLIDLDASTSTEPSAASTEPQTVTDNHAYVSALETLGEKIAAIERAEVKEHADGIEVTGLAGIAFGRRVTTTDFAIEIELVHGYEGAGVYASGVPNIDLTPYKHYTNLRVELRASINRYDVYESYYHQHLSGGNLWPPGFYPALIKWGQLGVLVQDGVLKNVAFHPLP